MRHLIKLGLYATCLDCQTRHGFGPYHLSNYLYLDSITVIATHFFIALLKLMATA